MWLARKAAELLDEEDDSDSQAEQNGESLISEISKLGGQIMTEGGSFLSEMNDTVFNGAVGDLLAPVLDASDLPGAGFTVGVLGASESDHDDVIVPVTQYLARTGFNVLATGPAGFSSCASDTFVQTSERHGKLLGIFPSSQRVKHKAGLPSRVEIPIYVGDNIFDVVVRSVDVLIVFPGDEDGYWAQLDRSLADTPCVVYRKRDQQGGPLLRACMYAESAEQVARFVMAHCSSGDALVPEAPKDPVPTTKKATKEATVPTPAPRASRKSASSSKVTPKSGRISPLGSSSDDLDSFEVIESPSRRRGIKLAS